ncbi:MAG: hypothetical protein Q8O03_01260 [Nanoarchaeota archaeon]|nr:hypothetical protein [Nanoarchaeota archaeon]
MPKLKNTVTISLQLFDSFTLLNLLTESMKPLFTDLRKNPNDAESKVAIQTRLAILEQILKSEHYQKLVNTEWNLYELKNPSIEQIITVLQGLLANDDMTDKTIKFPKEVRRFCDKYLQEIENHYT